MSLKLLLLAPLALTTLTLPALAEDPGQTIATQTVATTVTSEEPLAQIAILLDTSGSMEGLVDQARCQLWNVVSELATASRGETPTKLEIAVYQYGSNKIPADQGFLRQVVGFTDNLDEVSRALFSLAVGGNKEFCGHVIDSALSDLEWDPSPSAYRAIFIAGNESFDQGRVTFGEAYPKALSHEVLLNSIYCAMKNDNKESTVQWDAAARLTGGMSFEIDHNHHLPEMMTPFDSRMRELNERMNATFVWFGEESENAAANQDEQDKNAAKMSDHAFAARMSAKIGHLYHHAHHDLIDAIDHGNVDLAKMEEAKMPESLQVMSADERVKFVEEKVAERDRVRREMADVISKRHAFLQQKMVEQAGAEGKEVTVLGDALVDAVRRQATKRGFEFDQGQTAQVSNDR